ncbi:MAG TPA: hydrolase [Stellaceae bacterium]|nr:hydrolase [Stellaceae bacterium]
MSLSPSSRGLVQTAAGGSRDHEEAIARARIVAEARSWVPTPYHHHGDLKGVGVDCAMILVRVYGAVGIIPPIDPRPYPVEWHLHRSEERYLGWVKRYGYELDGTRDGPPRPGDLALYRFGRCFSHSAIVIDWPLVVHAYIRGGCQYAEGDQGWLGRDKRGNRPVKFYSFWPAEGRHP